MTDEFEALMSQQFEPETFAESESIADHGVLPATVDDHEALHLLEAEIQLAAFLYAQDFVGEFAAAECPELHRCLNIGLGAYMAETMPEQPQLHTVEDIEWMAWVRLAAGQGALGLEAFITEHGLKKVTVMVHLSNHGWYPFTIRGAE